MDGFDGIACGSIWCSRSGCLQWREIKKRDGGTGPEIDWLYLWSFGTQCLGLSDTEFWWAYSWSELNARIERYREQERAANYRAGIVAAAVYNVNRKPNSDPINAMDFFASEVRNNDEELTPGIRPASEILAEVQRAVAVVKGRL